MTDPTLAKLAASRLRLLQAVASLPEARLETQPADGGWSIRQHLTHLAASEADHCQVIEAISQNQPQRLPAQLDRDAHNAARLAEMGFLSLPQLLAALAEQRQRSEALFNSLDPAQLELKGAHPVLGEMTVSGIFRILAIHEQMHAREIEALARSAQL